MNVIKPNNSLATIREKYIRLLDASNDTQKIQRELADDLFSLDLTVYSQDYSFNSLVYSAFAKSRLDDKLSLHPEQVEIINKIKNEDALIISAPTSFGKTFCIFEYIARYNPQNIVLIVPTLALVDEYLKKIIRRYSRFFSRYKININIDAEKKYNFNVNNIFILTHDKTVQESAYRMIEKIDLLVIDEVYKLETDKDDRVLVLNMAYYYLAKIAKKYVLLAPFIKSIQDADSLEKKPIFYHSDYSPVVNDVKKVVIKNQKDRNKKCEELLLSKIADEKTLVYFPSVVGINSYINNIICKYDEIKVNDTNIDKFIKWASNEIHSEWSVIKALKRGYLVHNGQIPMGIRLFQLNLFETQSGYNKLLCTSTLLEGINTTAKYIIITRPSRLPQGDERNFSAFDFYNLVGRTGRLFQHYVGTAFYIKAPEDPDYRKEEAIRDIRFELTDDSIDVDIQKGNWQCHPDVVEFLKTLNISINDYLENIGSRYRFETIKTLHKRYLDEKNKLISELEFLHYNPNKGRHNLIGNLYQIIEGTKKKNEINIINSLLHRKRRRIKSIVDEACKYSKAPVDFIISTTIRLKTSYIEYDFYSKILLVKYFMELENTPEVLIEELDKRVISAIEMLYFSNSKQKKMLLELGFYESDIDNVIKIIGNDFYDAFELKNRLIQNRKAIKKISFLTDYVINELIK